MELRYAHGGLGVLLDTKDSSNILSYIFFLRRISSSCILFNIFIVGSERIVTQVEQTEIIHSIWTRAKYIEQYQGCN